MAQKQRLICESRTLIEGGRAMRFDRVRDERKEACFAIRFDETARAYVNSCPHQGTELDWQPGEVFDESGLYLICATHGALFDPATGLCVSGPCRGASLTAVAVMETADGVVLTTAEADESS